MKETIGQRLRRLRKAAGLSQRDLEARTDGQVLNTTISHIEIGRVTAVSVQTVALLARAIGCDPIELAGFDYPRRLKHEVLFENPELCP